jgi:glycerophosphoryl diester phosphodiesterase
MLVRTFIFTLLSTLSFFQSARAQMIVAHRGASYDAPENTLAAFNLAWKLGADGVEGDFYVTKDQQIVCIHDADTKRTGGKKLGVAQSTLEELRGLEYGKWKGDEFAGEPIPTFADVLKSIPADKKFIIELKTGPEIVPLLRNELEEYHANEQQLLIIAFNASTVAECKRMLPNVKVHWLTGYKQDKQSGEWSPGVDSVIETLKTCQADGLGTQGNRTIVTPEFIAKLKANGLREFHVWTIDEPSDAVYFQQLGAMGITTNRPDLIRKTLGR